MAEPPPKPDIISSVEDGPNPVEGPVPSDNQLALPINQETNVAPAGSSDEAVSLAPVITGQGISPSSSTVHSVEKSVRSLPVVPAWEPIVIDRPIARFEPKPAFVQPYRPDSVIDGYSTERFTVRAASIRGYAHRDKNVPRQDDLAIGFHEAADSLIIAVADGVSSAAKSHLGSTLVCRYAVDWILRHMEGDGWKEPNWDKCIRDTAWALVEYAHQNLGQPHDAIISEKLLATTLIIAVVWVVESGELQTDIVHVGDSSAWILSENGYRRLVGGKEHEPDGIVSSAVTGLPRVPNFVQPAQALVAPNQVLLVGTDGFGDPLGDGDGLVGRLFAEQLIAVPPPLQFAHLLDFSRETFDDDRTLVAIWPRPAGAPTRW